MALPRLQHIFAQDPKLPVFRRRSLNMLYFAAALSVVTVFLSGIWGIVFSIFAVGYVILLTQFNIYHRNQIENFHHYRQLEAMMSLYDMLDIRYPLPPLRLWVISPDFANLLVGHILRHKPKLLVELGSGASTILSSYCVEKIGVGKIVSFEHIEDFAEASRRGLDEHGLTEYAKVIQGDLTTTTIKGQSYQWYDTLNMQDLSNIDLLVVDGPPDGTHKMARYPALPVLYDRLADNAIILVDDYMRDDEYEMVNLWIEEFDLEVVQTIDTEKGTAILRKKSSQIG